MRVIQAAVLLACVACKTAPPLVNSGEPATCEQLCARANQLRCAFGGEMCTHMCFGAISSGLYRPRVACLEGSVDCDQLDRCVL